MSLGLIVNYFDLENAAFAGVVENSTAQFDVDKGTNEKNHYDDEHNNSRDRTRRTTAAVSTDHTQTDMMIYRRYSLFHSWINA